MADDLNEPERFTVKTTADSHFAWLRTRLSIENTLMAWIRTATALIGFGFTIVQFLDRFQEMSNVAPALRPSAPRYVGLTLILAGILSLAIAVWQYRQLMAYLWGQPFDVIAGVARAPKRTPLVPVAITLIVIGIFAYVTVFWRLQ